MSALVSPIDAYGEARHGSQSRHVGWGYYRDHSLGFHADPDGRSVDVYSTDGKLDVTISAGSTPGAFLDALDAEMDRCL